jgi:hypothetical protein
MRRITASAFNESTNNVVWRESIRQGQQMIRYWLSSGLMSSTAVDTKNFAVNVLMKGGFGQSHDFVEEDKTNKATDMNFRDAMKIVIENAFILIGVGPSGLPVLGHLIPKMAEVGEAYAAFRGFIGGTIDKTLTTGGDSSPKGNLLESLVHGVAEKTLSSDEVYGNMFVYMFGGHDTTAHSLAFTFLLMSIHPEVQRWMTEEITNTFSNTDPNSWRFEDLGKLNRVQAVQVRRADGTS